MGPNIHLIIHNIVSISSTVATLGIALFTFLNGPKKTANVTFSLLMIAVSVFNISHAVGVSVGNPELSRNILTLALLSVFFLGAFNLHATFALIGKEKEKKWLIIFTYISAGLFVLLFLAHQDLLLLSSVPKMYFPNYYSPGALDWTRMVFLHGIIFPFMVYLISMARHKSTSTIEKKQYKYFLMTIVFGYVIGFIPNFLVYNVPIDPLWGMSFSLIFTIPFMYGSVKYEMFSVKVIAKQAFLYSIAVAIVGGLIILFDYSNSWLHVAYPNFPLWTTALVSAVLAVTVSIVVWKRLRENDLLKNEFITTVTHKFRTPLTQIKWVTENISSAKSLEEVQGQIAYIRDADSKLVSLTDLLVRASGKEGPEYLSKFISTDISKIVKEVTSALTDQLKIKHLTLVEKIEPNMYALCDGLRIKFAIQVLMENAIQYTPANGVITVSTYSEGKNIICMVQDTGIGMSKEELSLIFSKFYRAKEAKLADTEGMGIGLFISKEIVERQGGKIIAKSNGLNTGSTFSMLLPRGAHRG